MLELMLLEIEIIPHLKVIFNLSSPIKPIELLYGGNFNYVLIFNEVISC